MLKIYFDIPYYKSLRSPEGWSKQNPLGTHYHVARAFFQLNLHQLSGPSSIGRKIDVIGHHEGMITTRTKTMEIETEIFQQNDTVKRSIVESECMQKVLNELTTGFGAEGVFKIGGKVSSEVSSKIKNSFTTEFKITNSSKKRELIKYEFQNTLPSDFKDTVCDVEVYQQCAADLYLIQVDFLNIEYTKTWSGLRKTIKKYPFPNNSNAPHPNVIQIGAPLLTLKYWELLPKSSRTIKDSDYRPDVTDDTNIEIMEPDSSLIDRPYWSIPKHPTLYQLSNIAFPYKWINSRNSGYSREELMKIELGEAEGSTWWFVNGPGRV